jgi:hypothetical protein
MPDENDANEFKHDVCNLCFEYIVLANRTFYRHRRGRGQALSVLYSTLTFAPAGLSTAFNPRLSLCATTRNLYLMTMLNHPATPFSLSHNRAESTKVRKV